jgi:hypothetical protein
MQISESRENFKIYLQIPREFLAGNSQCWSNLVYNQLPLYFVYVFIGRDSSGLKKLIY